MLIHHGRTWKLSLLGFLMLVLPVAIGRSQSQTFRATITGTVTDASGAVIPNAKVTAKSIDTNFLTAAVTNSAGTYSMPFIPPGIYTLAATVPNFMQAVRESVELHAGDNIHVDFSLQVGATSQAVTVSARGEMLQIAAGAVGQVVGGQQVVDLPLMGRNTFMLASTVPGMVAGVYENMVSQYGRPFDGAGVQMSASGQGSQTYMIMLDGMPDDLPERASGATYTGFVPSPDAVEEVNTQTSLYDAEYGHTSGALINTVLKNGANQYHGAAYEYVRNTIFNANCFQCNYAHQPTSVAHFNEPGFVFDGPLRIPGVYNGTNKTFFMVSWEAIRNSNPTPGVTTVPTAQEKLGNFTGLLNSSGKQVQIYDPSTTTLSGNGARTAFPNNTITNIDPVAKNLLQYFPSPNVPGNAYGFNNLVYGPNSQVDRYYSLAFRLDHQITASDRLTGTFERSMRSQVYPTAGLQAVASAGYLHHRNDMGGSVDWTHIISPTTVLDVRAGAMYHPFSIIDYGDNFNLASLGFPSTLLSQVPYQTFPNITLANYTALSTTGSQVSVTTGLDIAATLSKSFSHHTLKMGFQFNNMRATLTNPISNFGSFDFNGQWTASSATNASGTSGWDFADFLLGHPDTGLLTWNNGYAYQRNYDAVFVQDDWRVRQRLTLTLGLRWDYESPFSERWNRQNAGFCTTCTNPISSQVTGFEPLLGGLLYTTASNRLPFTRTLNDWGPRIGAAYRLTSKSVLRGGFGMIYPPTFDTGQNNGYSANTPFVATTNNYTPGTSTLSNPYPQGITAPTGNSLGLSTLLGLGFSVGNPVRTIPRIEQFSLAFEYQLPSDMVLSIGYFGNRDQRREVTDSNINALPAKYFSQGSGALNTAVANPMYGFLPANSSLEKATLPAQNLLVPFPEFGKISQANNPYGGSSYDALQSTLTKRMTHGLSLRGAFTWAKTMDRLTYLNTNDPLTSVARYQDAQPNIYFTLTPTWNLPFFANSKGLVHGVLGGWQTNGIFRWEGGRLVNNPTGAFSTGVSPVLPSGQQTLSHWFNTCTITLAGGLQNCLPGQNAANASWMQQPSFTLNVLSPTMPGVRSHITPDLDFSLFKQVTLHERLKLEVRAECFNLTNSVQFGAPNTSLNSSQFGVIALSEVNDPRMIQLAMKLLF